MGPGNSLAVGSDRQGDVKAGRFLMGQQLDRGAIYCD